MVYVNTYWTDEEKQTLTRMWNEGYRSSDICNEIGKVKNAVISMAHRLKLPPHPSRNGGTPRKPKTPRQIMVLPRQHTPKPPRAVEPIIITSSGVSFLEAKDSQCHAIIGRDEKTASFLSGLVRYCGNPVKEGSWACPWHYNQFYYTPIKARHRTPSTFSTPVLWGPK